MAFRDRAQLRLMTRNRQSVADTYPEVAGALRAQNAADFLIGRDGIMLTDSPRPADGP